jgi:pimeloyl-ACP methyl ester carboxylesterase
MAAMRSEAEHHVLQLCIAANGQERTSIFKKIWLNLQLYEFPELTYHYLMNNKMNLLFFSVFLVLAMAFNSCSILPNTPQPDLEIQTFFDPVSMDPLVTDSGYPSTFKGWSFEIEGSPVNALWWQPEGKGPNPTILILHGYPGNEKNLDLARVLQRAGFNVMFLHYRGTWGSAGHFTFSNALKDIATAVDQVRTCFGEPECETPVDPNKVALFGHSMGGWLAMLSAIEVPGISCAAILDFGDLGFSQFFAEHGDVPPWLKEHEEYWTLEGSPLRIEGEGALSSDLLANVNRFGLVGRSADLAKQHLFILSTGDNEGHPILVQALKEQKAKHLRAEVWDTDHPFNNRRVQLARAMVEYFGNTCFN